MTNNNIGKPLLVIALSFLASCVAPLTQTKNENKYTPSTYIGSKDSTNCSDISWKIYFNDSYLNALIDSALKNNQELNITMQEIQVLKNEVRARKGEYLPFVNLMGGAGAEKTPEYTRNGSIEQNLHIKENTPFPKPYTDYIIGAQASWELDVWKKLRNARKSAAMRYLADVEGRNFMVTNLISEIALSYYELLALDNQLDIVDQNIKIQSDALQIIRQEKDAAVVSQLAVNRFEAQLLNTQNLQYDIKQKITETENRINFLVGRFPQPVQRSKSNLFSVSFNDLNAGIPSQLLNRRPDVRQASYELQASKLDVKSAKANFYPSFRITAGAGFQAFNTSFLISPESVLLNLAGDAVAPLINRNAIKAYYQMANARQIQAVYNYERSILNAYVEVMNELSRVNNYGKSFETKSKEVDILTNSITISNNLFKSARADYMEVLLTQRESLESRMQLIEIRLKQLEGKVKLYRALGGGWN